MAEGNVDKINKLKTRFIGGLTIIAGSLTAITLGIKSTIGLIGNFAGLVARTAFGGLLKVGLKGVQVLLAGLVKNAALLGGGFFAGGIKGFISSIGGFLIYDQIAKFIGNIFRKKTKIPVPSNITRPLLQSGRNITKTLSGTQTKGLLTGVDDVAKNAKPGILNRVINPIRKKLFPTTADILSKPGTQSAMLNPAKMGLNPLKNTIGKLFSKLPGKNVLAKLLSAVGVKGGLKTLFKKFGGPLATFVINLASGDGIGKALAATAGYAAAAAATAAALYSSGAAATAAAPMAVACEGSPSSARAAAIDAAAKTLSTSEHCASADSEGHRHGSTVHSALATHATSVGSHTGLRQ